MKRIDVAVAIISNEDGEYLVSRRLEHQHLGGLWEFPGGKLESGETVDQALVREIHEELGLQISASESLMVIEHDYPEKQVCLHVHKVSEYKGEPEGREGQALKWLASGQFIEQEFPEANRAIIRKLQFAS